MMAIVLLGELKSNHAALAFATVVDEEDDPYALRAIVYALARIGGELSWDVIRRLRFQPSIIVRNAIEDVDHAVGERDR
jgi:hypothetical protein